MRSVSSPWEATGSPIQHTAVFKGIRKAGDINAAAAAKGVDCHLNLFILLDQNLGVFEGVDVFLPLTEVYSFSHIGQNKVFGVLLPVVFVVAQGKAGLFLHAQDIGQLEVMSLVLVAEGSPTPIKPPPL